MEKLQFTADQRQGVELSALAYRIADNSYMLERYGRFEASEELEENAKTLNLIFDILDRLKVPFWVQNSVICEAENWRSYASGRYRQNLKQKGITL